MSSKPVASCWHDVTDCCMLPYDVGDHFEQNFPFLTHFKSEMSLIILKINLKA